MKKITLLAFIKNYSNSSSIYTPEQMLNLIDGLILEEKKND